MSIRFRGLASGDLPQVRSWLAMPHVAAWWHADDEDLRGLVRGDDSTEAYVIELDERPVGFIQLYPAVDSLPSGVLATSSLFARYPREETAGLDLFLGEGLGHGPAILRAFLAAHVFPRFRYAMLDPARGNARAIRAFEKAGFTHTGAGDDEHLILVAVREPAP